MHLEIIMVSYSYAYRNVVEYIISGIVFLIFLLFRAMVDDYAVLDGEVGMAE